MFEFRKDSDGRLVREVLAGRKESFNALVEPYLPMVYALAYSHTGSRYSMSVGRQDGGQFEFNQLPTGDYELSAGTNTTTLVTETVTLEAGETLERVFRRKE
jgi:hypothetical protein